jgi:hypothetical protein
MAIQRKQRAPEFYSEITLCCTLLKTQGKFRGWEFGTISATG